MKQVGLFLAAVCTSLALATCPVGNIADIELPRLGLRFKAGSQANGRGGLECMGFSGLCLKLRLIACPVIDVPIWTSYIQLYPVIRQDHTEHPSRLMNARALKCLKICRAFVFCTVLKCFVHVCLCLYSKSLWTGSRYSGRRHVWPSVQGGHHSFWWTLMF